MKKGPYYYNYMRISTKEERGLQKYTRQEKAIESYAKKNNIDFLMSFREDISGKNFEDRTEWNKLERIVQPGDTIVFKDISRFSREAENGYKMYMQLYRNDINMVFLDNQTLSTDYIREMLDNAEKQEIITKTILDAMVKILLITELARCEKERLTISQRTRDGIAARRIEAAEQGIEWHIGRRPGQLMKMTTELRDDIERYITDRTVKSGEIMHKYNICYNTLKKYANIVRNEKKIQSQVFGRRQ